MNVRVSSAFSDSGVRTLAHRHRIRTFRIVFILEIDGVGLKVWGLGKICQTRLRVSGERFRSAHEHEWLSGRGQKIFGGVNIVRLRILMFKVSRLFVTAVNLSFYLQVSICLMTDLVQVRLDDLCHSWSHLRGVLGEAVGSLCSSDLGPSGRFHMRGHLIESYVILVLQNGYVVRFGNMKWDRTFWGERLCSIVRCLRERTESHRWKVNEEMILTGEFLLDGGQAGYRGEGSRDLNRRSE